MDPLVESSKRFIRTLEPTPFEIAGQGKKMVGFTPANVMEANAAAGWDSSFAITVDSRTNASFVNPIAIIPHLVAIVKHLLATTEQVNGHSDILSQFGAMLDIFKDVTATDSDSTSQQTDSTPDSIPDSSSQQTDSTPDLSGQPVASSD